MTELRSTHPRRSAHSTSIVKNPGLGGLTGPGFSFARNVAERATRMPQACYKHQPRMN
jgi:hypothetical protein